MFKKTIKKEVKKEQEGQNHNGCIVCGIPATITSNSGRKYCCLACQTANHD
jgi:hypothetical protein